MQASTFAASQGVPTLRHRQTRAQHALASSSRISRCDWWRVGIARAASLGFASSGLCGDDANRQPLVRLRRPSLGLSSRRPSLASGERLASPAAAQRVVKAQAAYAEPEGTPKVGGGRWVGLGSVPSISSIGCCWRRRLFKLGLVVLWYLWV